ncbi:MAG: hypothetical protein D6795_09145, partial [Deltaproteobacteria bacterium]
RRGFQQAYRVFRCRCLEVEEDEMKTTRQGSGWGRIFAAVIGVVALASPAVAQLNVEDLVSFTRPIGVDVYRDKVVVVRYCPQEVILIDGEGNQERVAEDLPDTGGCVEMYVAVSPGLGGFAKDHIFVTQSSKIYEIAPEEGFAVSLFANVSGLSGGAGIKFDTTGAFDNDMILTGTNGRVFRMNAQGEATQLANIGTVIENPDIAPLDWGPLGGTIVVPSESTGRVYSVSAEGVVTTLATGIPAAEAANFIPTEICDLGEGLGAWFGALYSVKIVQIPAADFTGMEGQLLVTSESANGLYLIRWDGQNYTVEHLQNVSGGSFEGSNWAHCFCDDPDNDGYGVGNTCEGPD